MAHQRHSYLRHGGRVLTLFGDDYQTNDNSDMTAGSWNTTTILTLPNMAENEPSPLPPANAPWHTRKTILFAEAIVVTAIVLPLIFCFFYQRAANKTNRLPPISRAIGNANNTVEEEQEEDDQPPRTILNRIVAVLSYPFRLIDSAVHSWSTANADITFLRSVMERLEEERVAQLEDFDLRGERLKVAFSKGESVWVSFLLAELFLNCNNHLLGRFLFNN